MPELVIATAAGSVLLRIDLRERDKLTIGRSDKCDVRLKGAEVSRHHALLINESGRWCIFDLSVRSGVWLGDERKRTIEMRDDVPVRIGDAYIWLFGAANVEPPPPPPLPDANRRRVMLRQEHLECLWRGAHVRNAEADEDEHTTTSALEG